MSSPLLLHQFPAYMVPLTCFVECCFQDLFYIAIYTNIYIYIYISGAEMRLVLLVPGTTNNSVNVIQNGLKIIH